MGGSRNKVQTDGPWACYISFFADTVTQGGANGWITQHGANRRVAGLLYFSFYRYRHARGCKWVDHATRCKPTGRGLVIFLFLLIPSHRGVQTGGSRNMVQTDG